MTQTRLTDHVVMVRPDYFGFNPETADSNIFQHDPTAHGRTNQEVRDKVFAEFEHVRETLAQHGIKVLTLPSPPNHITPDAVFPNNWFSHHEGGRLVVYPMMAANRRAERQPEALTQLLKANNVPVRELIDLSSQEEQSHILEGTGSLVLDRANKVAFAMLSARTTKPALEVWSQRLGYEVVSFSALDESQRPIYHTNVAMSIGDRYAIICLESIRDQAERSKVTDKLQSLGKEIVELTLDQVHAFCGNVLQLKSSLDGIPRIVLSQTAYDALTDGQWQSLQKFGELVVVSVPTIESVGGGGVRCMLAEVFPSSHVG